MVAFSDALTVEREEGRVGTSRGTNLETVVERNPLLVGRLGPTGVHVLNYIERGEEWSGRRTEDRSLGTVRL